tara:strand:- start:1477 stop:1683 length:207 start_codon:yes stop_codon:yes gene_type:complete
MTKKQNKDNCIHVIDLKKQTIKPMDNFELSMWLNEFSVNNDNDLSKKRYLFAPNAESAVYILTEMKVA